MKATKHVPQRIVVGVWMREMLETEAKGWSAEQLANAAIDYFGADWLDRETVASFKALAAQVMRGGDYA